MMRRRDGGWRYWSLTRRAVLVGGLAAVAGAGGGVALGMVRPLHSGHSDKPPPQELLAALGAEQALLSRIDAAARRDPTLGRRLAGVRADHEAHLAAVEAALRAYAPTEPQQPAPVTTPPNRAQLRDGEAAATTASAQRAAALSGRDAALLASIAASEATHAEVLA
jgi:hypothetical protein